MAPEPTEALQQAVEAYVASLDKQAFDALAARTREPAADGMRAFTRSLFTTDPTD
jgi:hypothetical protein